MEAGTQFIGIKPEINMQERKSNVANNPTDVFTIEDIAAVSRPYKVYTALLTQSGGDNPQTLTFGGGFVLPLEINVTYEILEVGPNIDFTLVGAPNNEVGTKFVATGTEPGTGSFPSSVLGYNTGAPVVTVLENTIGNIWFTYEDSGFYKANSSDGLFTQDKTFFLSQTTLDNSPNAISILMYYSFDDYNVALKTLMNGSGYENGFLDGTPIEIRVYE
jgi:hypothetical protein